MSSTLNQLKRNKPHRSKNLTKYFNPTITRILIENQYLDKLKYDDLIENFASKNERISYFL